MSALERMLGEFAALGAQAGARDAAVAALRAHGLPTRRDENWHYADLRALEGLAQFRPATPARHGATPPLPELPEPLDGFTRLVFVDGALSGSWPLRNPTGVTRLPTEAAATPPPVVTEFESSGDGRMGLIARMFAPEP